MLPQLAAIGCYPYAVTTRHVVANGLLAATYIDHVWVRLAHGDRTDRAPEEAIGDILPGRPAIGCAPDAAAGTAEVEKLWLARHAGDSRRPPAAERADESVPQPTKKRVIRGRCSFLCRSKPGDRGGDQERQRNYRAVEHGGTQYVMC